MSLMDVDDCALDIILANVPLQDRSALCATNRCLRHALRSPLLWAPYLSTPSSPAGAKGRVVALRTLSQTASASHTSGAVQETCYGLILECLEDSEEGVRREAVLALSRLARTNLSASALPCVCTKLNDVSPFVRQAALDALGALIDSPATGVSGAWLENYGVGSIHLTNAKGDTLASVPVPLVLQSLPHDCIGVRLSTKHLSEKLMACMAAELASALNHPDPAMRKEKMTCLVPVMSSEAHVMLLLQLLQRPEAEACRSAVSALLESTNAAGVAVKLGALLGSKTSTLQVRQAVLEVLEGMPVTTAVAHPHIMHAIQKRHADLSEDRAVRVRARTLLHRLMSLTASLPHTPPPLNPTVVDYAVMPTPPDNTLATAAQPPAGIDVRTRPNAPRGMMSNDAVDGSPALEATMSEDNGECSPDGGEDTAPKRAKPRMGTQQRAAMEGGNVPTSSLIWTAAPFTRGKWGIVGATHGRTLFTFPSADTLLTIRQTQECKELIMQCVEDDGLQRAAQQALKRMHRRPFTYPLRS